MAFLQAAYDRDYVGMDEALNNGDANTLYTKDLYGNTAMLYAAFCSNTRPDGWWCHPRSLDTHMDNDSADQDALKMVQFLLKKEQQIEDKIGENLVNIHVPDEPSKLVNEHNNSGWAPLIFAEGWNLENTVAELINAGANVDATPSDGLEGAGDNALKSSAWHGNYEITKLLLSKGAKVNFMRNKRPTERYWTVLTIACARNLPEIVKTILKREKDELTPEFLSLTTPDGDSALSYALAYGLSEVVERLISLGASLYIPKKSMSESSQKNEAISTEMQLLNIDPKTLTKFFDDHIIVKYDTGRFRDPKYQMKEQIEKMENIKNIQIKFDFKCITQNDNSGTPLILHPKYDIFTDTKVLEDIVRLSKNHKKILKHPLPRALLMKKWYKIKNYYWGWIISNLLFLICLVALALTHGPSLHNGMKQLKDATIACNTITTNNNLNLVQMNTSAIIENSTDPNTSCYQEYQAHTRLYTLIAFTILLVFMVLVELLQIFVSLIYWMKEAKNYGQLSIIALSLFLVYDLFQEDQKFELDLHLIGFLIPMVFYGLLHEFGYHPRFAKYILLLDKVCRTFFFHGTVYIGLVIMPAISLYMIIEDKDDSFSDDFSKLFAKTIVMFVGEVELFPLSSNATFKLFEIGFFFFFIFFLVVVLMNLLNALAIMDTKELLEDVEIEMLHSLLETVAFWENLRKNDPYNKFEWSLLKTIKYLIKPCSSVSDHDCEKKGKELRLVPNMSVLENVSMKPYQSTDDRYRYRYYRIVLRLKKLFGVMCKHLQPTTPKSEMCQECDFIVTSAFAINHRKEEEERCKQKEQEREERDERLERLVNEILGNTTHGHAEIIQVLQCSRKPNQQGGKGN